MREDDAIHVNNTKATLHVIILYYRRVRINSIFVLEKLLLLTMTDSRILYSRFNFFFSTRFYQILQYINISLLE